MEGATRAIDQPRAVAEPRPSAPTAVTAGAVILRRPTTLPYLVIAHALLDLSLPILVLVASLP